MGNADRVPNRAVMSEHQRIPRVVPILGSTDRHLAAAVLASARCTRYRWWAGSGLLRTSVGLAAHHHGPDDTGHLVGHRHPPELLRLPPHPSPHPPPTTPGTPAGGGPALACRIPGGARSTRGGRGLWSPAGLFLPGRCLPAVEFSRGVMPIHAAKCRPERKAFGSGTLSVKLTPPIGPMPGIVARHWLVWSCRCHAISRASIALSLAFTASSWLASTSIISRARAG